MRAAAWSRGTYCGERDRRARARRQARSFSAGAAAQHAQGSLVFSSGANANVRATVKSVGVGVGAEPHLSAALRAGRRRRLHRLRRLRPHARRPARRGSPTSPAFAASRSSRRVAMNGLLTGQRAVRGSPRASAATSALLTRRPAPFSPARQPYRWRSGGARRGRRGGARLDRHALPSRGRRQGRAASTAPCCSSASSATSASSSRSIRGPTRATGCCTADEERYLGFLLARAREVERRARRRDPVPVRTLLRAWRNRDASRAADHRPRLRPAGRVIEDEVARIADSRPAAARLRELLGLIR